MTNIAPGSEQMHFRHKEDVADYILKNILSNKNRKIGTEWEMFFVNHENGKAISRVDGQKAFVAFEQVFARKGYITSYVYEQNLGGQKTIIELRIDGLGAITPEMGHQFEFSCAVCEDIDGIREKNEEFFDAVWEVATQLGYRPVFQGHIPGYVETSEGSHRSRSESWHEYFGRRFGPDALRVCETLDATASTQITLDSGAEKFHEFFKALLLIEPALTIYYANSRRSHIGVHYMPTSHIKPVVNIWEARSAQEAVRILVDRIMQIEVPFLPDAEHPDLYKAEPLLDLCPPTVGDLLIQGRLNEKTLNNAGGFLLSRPAVRKFSQGLIEMRGVDSQSTPAKIGELSQHVRTFIYNDAVREGLLEDYVHLSALDIYKMHYASTLMDKRAALNTVIAGQKMASYIKDIIGRSEADLLVPHVTKRMYNRIATTV